MLTNKTTITFVFSAIALLVAAGCGLTEAKFEKHANVAGEDNAVGFEAACDPTDGKECFLNLIGPELTKNCILQRIEDR